MTGPEQFSVPVTVMVPSAMYGRLNGVARRHGVTVSSLLIEAARRGLVKGDAVTAVRRPGLPKTKVYVRQPWRDADTERLRELHAEGWSDGAIAKELGRAQGTVSKRRRDLGLPALFDGKRPLVANGALLGVDS